MAKFTTLYSGSSGNCAVVEEGGRYLLVDMGAHCRPTRQMLQELGLDPQGLAGVLVTHEHIDHVRGLRVFLRQLPVPLFATAATLKLLAQTQLVPEEARLVPVEGGRLPLGDFLVHAFPTSHDAVASCGYRIETAGGGVVALATDLGKMTAGVFCMLEGAQVVALEANYDREMLRLGSYPPHLKRRIASVQGHLSNNDSAAAVAQLVATGCRNILLCHLSEENNRPELVRQAVDTALLESGQRLPAGCRIEIASRHHPSAWMEF